VAGCHVDERHQLATLLDEGRQSLECRRRIRRVVEHVPAVDEVELASTKWKLEDVGLQEVDIAPVIQVGKSGVDRPAHVHCNDAAAVVQDDLAEPAEATSSGPR
jgi:hypothetical protein